MQDIKPRNKKGNNKVMRKSDNSSDILIKKIIIISFILIFIGIIIFYFIRENKNSDQINIERSNSEQSTDENAKEIIVENNNDSKENMQNEQVKKEDSLTSSKAKQIIESKAQESITAIKNKDFTALAELIHPDHELVLSPYANFNTENQSFSRNEVKGLVNDSTKYNWGNYNGLAVGVIETSFSDYYELFIYDQDYANAEKISYNKDLSNGKIKNNSQNFFENSITVEYYFSGFDPELKEKGMDWRSLRLVFIEVDGEWYLRGISHDELTI